MDRLFLPTDTVFNVTLVGFMAGGSPILYSWEVHSYEVLYTNDNNVIRLQITYYHNHHSPLTVDSLQLEYNQQPYLLLSKEEVLNAKVCIHATNPDQHILVVHLDPLFV
jgi:hypothetical protein